MNIDKIVGLNSDRTCRKSKIKSECFLRYERGMGFPTSSWKADQTMNIVSAHIGQLYFQESIVGSISVTYRR